MNLTERVFKAAKALNRAHQWRDASGQPNHRLIQMELMKVSKALELWVGHQGELPVDKSDLSPRLVDPEMGLHSEEFQQVLRATPACKCGSTDGYHAGDCPRWANDASHVHSHESVMTDA